MDDRLAHLIEVAEDHYAHDDAGHDFNHIRRVLETALKLADVEGADPVIVGPAALLHDLVNLPKDHPDRSKASAYSADAARPLLAECAYDDEAIKAISAAIVEHSFSSGHQPSSLESAVLQDADRLDAIGAIGIMRASITGNRLGSALYEAGDPFALERPLEEQRFIIDHFYQKLFRLPERMNTAAGRAEADRRLVFMRAFVDQLKSEIAGSLD